MGDWEDLIAESERVIGEALEQQRAYDADCTCGAVDVPGAVHLDWCSITMSEPRDGGPPR